MDERRSCLGDTETSKNSCVERVQYEQEMHCITVSCFPPNVAVTGLIRERMLLDICVISG